MYACVIIGKKVSFFLMYDMTVKDHQYRDLVALYPRDLPLDTLEAMAMKLERHNGNVVGCQQDTLNKRHSEYIHKYFFFLLILRDVLWYRAPSSWVSYLFRFIFIIRMMICRITWYQIYASAQSAEAYYPPSPYEEAPFPSPSFRPRLPPHEEAPFPSPSFRPRPPTTG